MIFYIKHQIFSNKNFASDKGHYRYTAQVSDTTMMP